MTEITFDDVMIALKVLREFERRAREVERTLRRFGMKSGRYRMPRSMEDFMNLVLQTYKPRSTGHAEEEGEELEEEELTEEELKRLREIAEKIKNRR